MTKAKKKKATKAKKKTSATRRKTRKPSTPDAPGGPSPGHQQLQNMVVEQWRRQPRDVPQQRAYDTDTPAPLRAAEIERTYKEVVRWITSVEAVIAEIRKAQTPGIGHNQPPDEIDEIEQELVVLKDKPTIADASRSVTKLHAIAAYIGKQADNFTTSAVKSAGKVAGATLASWPLWHQLIDPLNALIQAVANFIAASGGTPPLFPI
jgi:hypothetical protein